MEYTFVAGKTAGQKITELRQKMAEKKASALVITALDEVACEYNSTSDSFSWQKTSKLLPKKQHSEL